MRFKVGDKVRFIGIVPKRFVNMTAEIDEVRQPDREFPYSIRFDNICCAHFPVMEHELEKILMKNVQLVFPFME